MKKHFLSLALASTLTLGYELKYVADSQFCIRGNQPLQVCTFAQEFYNFIDLTSRLKEEELKEAKIQAKIKKHIDSVCFSWELIPPIGRDFLIERVTHNENPLFSRDEIFDFCTKR